MKIDTKGKDYFEGGKVYHADEDGFVNTPGIDTSENTDITKEALIAKALELELGTEAELNAMSIDDLTKLIADSVDTSDSSEKETLIAKALELKAAYPKAFKASPSQIPPMSVEKLTKLISDAEAAIAAGNQE